MKSKQEPMLFSVKQMAKYANVDAAWLREQAYWKRIPAVAVGHDRFLFDPSAVMEKLAAMAVADVKKDGWLLALWKRENRSATKKPSQGELLSSGDVY